MPAWAPERGSRTPTLSGPPCARAKSPAAVASNPAAPAPMAKPRRGRPKELGVLGIILSYQGGSRLACPVFSYSSLPDAMGHDSALGGAPRAGRDSAFSVCEGAEAASAGRDFPPRGALA